MADLSKLYDEIGKDYMEGQTDFYTERDDSPTAFIKESLGNLRGKTVLDLGCGHGKDLRMFREMGAKEVYGADPSEYMISEAKKKARPEDKLFVASSESLPFPDRFFDAIASRFVLHYLEDFKKTYHEVARVMKSGGTFVFVANHPFRDLLLQKDKVYGQQEIVSTKLFNNGAEITFHSHTMEEYLSEDFLKLFNLTAYVDGEQNDELERYEIVVPGFLGIAATRR